MFENLETFRYLQNPLCHIPYKPYLRTKKRRGKFEVFLQRQLEGKGMASGADGRGLARRTVLLFDDALDLCLYIPLAKVTDQAGNLSCLIAEHDRAHGR